MYSQFMMHGQTNIKFTVTPVDRIIADTVVQVVVLNIVNVLSVPAHWASHLAYTMSQPW